MAYLVKIGNSQGIRIPKPLVEQAHLEGKELQLQVVNGGLFIAPIKTTRQGWKKSIEEIITPQGTEVIDQQWLNADLIADDELEW